MPKGTPGADVIHDVVCNGRVCGRIVYDSKNRNDWKTAYATKLCEDKIAAEAQHAILSTLKFPAGAKQLHAMDVRQVRTKFSRSFATWFFPVGDDIRQVVVDWVIYLRQESLWSLDDPLFPATKIVVGDSRHFEASGLDRKHWSSAGPRRTRTLRLSSRFARGPR